MAVPQLEPELAEHLRVEFGAQGTRAVEFLETAQRTLVADADAGPRVGETVTYHCREALESILSAGRSGVGGRWRVLSRQVVKAADRYNSATEIHDEGAPRLLAELLRSIDEVERFHLEGESRHQKELIAVIVRRAGVPPSEGGGAVSAFQDLFDHLNKALHGDCSFAEAHEMFDECIGLIRRLFLPRDIRDGELRSLAAIGSPSPADVRNLLDLVGTPRHLALFVRSMASSQWLVQLDAAKVFDGEHIEVWWALAAAAERLGPGHAETVLDLLTRLWQRSVEDAERVQCVANAALRVGLVGAPALLEILRKHPDNGAVVVDAMQVTTQLEASAPLVSEFVDLLFNEACWSHLYVPEDIAEHFIAGIDEHNALTRLKVLCFKLRAEDPHDLLLSRLRWDPRGSLADDHERVYPERSPVLVSCLVSALRHVWEFVPTGEVLVALEGLPAGLQERARSWVLSQIPGVKPELLFGEVERSIGTRLPTGDDVALVDRAVQALPAGGVMERWVRALGDAPSVEEIEQSKASDSRPTELLRRANWVQLLPGEATGAWRSALPLIQEAFGIIGREQLTHRPRAEAVMASSPLSEEELGALSPDRAAEQVAAWRAGPGEWDHDAQQLARTLERVVRQAPHEWLNDPVGHVEKLHHPTYISAYLDGIKEAIPDCDPPVEPLLDAIALVDSRPWPVAPLADSPMDYDTDWSTARRAGRTLLAAMASADVQFGSRSDQAWELLYNSATDLGERSWASTGDPLTRAINRDCTRAFDATVLFVASELRIGKPVRDEFVALLRFALTRTGTDGEEYRAIAARRLAWLRHAVPDWFDNNAELLFGNEAPTGLAQATVDLAIHWGQPDRWLLEACPEMVKDAVARGVEQAMDHLMIAMLWGCGGYHVADIVRFIESSVDGRPDIASQAGMSIGRIVSDEGAEQQHIETAVQLWEAMLDSSAKTKLAGFGWMHQVAALDDERWANLTRRTLEATPDRGFWLLRSVDRAMEPPPTKAKLAVLDAMVRGHLEPWHSYHISEGIEQVLQNAGDLESTVEFQRLVTALREHDMIRDDSA